MASLSPVGHLSGTPLHSLAASALEDFTLPLLPVLTMSPRRFVVAFALSVGGVAAGVVAVNLIVNPLGTSPATVTIRGFNQEKVARSGKDRLHKPIDVVVARPRTV